MPPYQAFLTDRSALVNEAEPQLPPASVDPSIEEFQKSRPAPTLAWWLALVAPFALTLGLLAAVWVIQGHEYVTAYLTAAAAAFFVFGRFVILLASGEPDPEQGTLFLRYLDAENLFAMLTWMDVMVAMFVAFHMSALFRIPFVGSRLEELVSDAQFILARQPWIRRVAFLGLVLFVIFPTSTTGSIGGTIFGRLLGMNRLRVILAILLGSVLGNGIMLLFADQIGNLFGQDSLGLRLAGVGGMAIALFLFERRIKTLKRRYLEEQAEQNLASDNSPESDETA